MMIRSISSPILLAFALALVSLSSPVFGQEEGVLPCGQNKAQAEFDGVYPQSKEGRRLSEEATRNAANAILERGANDDEVYIIPVVFHVIHDNGPENISTEQILDAMEVLNEDFRKLNADTGQIVAGFVDIAADVDIEFRLAKRDPEGNCHSGINRIEDELTYDGSNEMKQIINWPRNSYMNVYVAANAGGAAGYTNYPSEWGANTDGIVLKHDYVGSIGTSNAYRSRTLTHECGHWLNLPHLWGSSNNPNEEDNCDVDDGVEDTPLCLGSPVGFCDLERATCGSLDNVQNYMEYSYCSKMYTTGQRARMRSALNSNVADRNQLWTDQNIEDTGVLEDELLCRAAFTVDRVEVCLGEALAFTDESFFGVTEWAWDFGDGVTFSGTDAGVHQNPVHVFETSGEFEVYLTVSNSTGSVTSEDPVVIQVLSDGALSGPVQEGFEVSEGPWSEGQWSVQSDGGQPWQIRENSAFSGSRSLYVRNRQNEGGEITRVTSSTFNAEGLASLMIGYKYAYSHRTTEITDDRLKLQVSKDCGETWNTRQFHRGLTDLPTAPDHGGNFYPSGEDEWTGHIEEVTNDVYFVPNLRLRFEFESKGGNNVFIDDINIYGVDSLGNILDLESVDTELSFGISAFPNPSSGEVTVDARWAGSSANLLVRDAAGRLERAVPLLGDGGRRTTLNGLSQGVHLLELNANGRREVLRLIVTD
ncbi:M43 family zinc metalloprotease [bacterium]|jgi:PKD repeat protein|nr:M43 family zinc metalloprotease [bacterium]